MSTPHILQELAIGNGDLWKKTVRRTMCTRVSDLATPTEWVALVDVSEVTFRDEEVRQNGRIAQALRERE